MNKTNHTASLKRTYIPPEISIMPIYPADVCVTVTRWYTPPYMMAASPGSIWDADDDDARW